MSYLLRRSLLGAAQVLALSLIAFLLLSVAPGHFHSTDALDPRRSEVSTRAWMHAQGLDRPWPARYGSWLRAAVHGDWGTSLAYGVPVSRLLSARMPQTIALVAPAWLLGWLIGLALALACAGRRRLLAALEPAAVVAGMLPEVIGGSLLIWAALAAGASLEGAWLPVAILMASIATLVFLHAAHSLKQAREERFVALAQARGVNGRVLWLRYILPAAGNPLLSLLAPSLVGAVASSLAVEALTGWPGLGPLFLEAFHSRDYPVVQAVLVLLAIALAVLNLLADLLLYRLDPRLSLGS